jgi:endogenous inhibitor of DNA gyrase (YacG/DUF329 family)
MKERICRWCEEKFEDMGGRIFSNHVRWCSKNPERNKTDFRSIMEEVKAKKNGKHKNFVVKCLTCETDFTVKEREKLFPQREKYFCSRSCANTKKHSEETKKKIKKSVLKFLNKEFTGVKKNCPHCKEDFYTTKNKKFCSMKCWRKNLTENFNQMESYRRKCKFGFNPYKYPNEFDIELLENRGFYSPTNKKNNLNGVSKDHMVSVRWGFENNIDPKIMSHPANCQLMIHSENISKHKKCDLTLEELLSKIREWEEKYGKLQDK